MKCCVEKLYGHFADASSILYVTVSTVAAILSRALVLHASICQKQDTSSIPSETTENMYTYLHITRYRIVSAYIYSIQLGLVQFFNIFLCYFQHKNKHHDQQLEQFNAQGDICTPVVR